MKISESITGKYFLHNNNIKSTINLSVEIPNDVKVFYEVLRIIDGKALFINEHLNRLRKSVELANEFSLDVCKLKSKINKLLNKSYINGLNLKISLFHYNQQQEVYAYFIQSQYPSTEMYQNGITVGILPAERKNPNVKLENPTLRNAANRAIEKNKNFEMLLINEQGYITEGSRSNFFAVFGNTLVTPPALQVLEGITRTMIINLAKQNHITIEERPIHINEIPNMDGAFITGTSPKVLPIATIDHHTFVSIPVITKKIMEYYNLLIEKSIREEANN